MSTTERKKMDEGQAAFYPSFPPPHNARAVRSVSTHPPNTGRPRGAPPGSICEAGRAVSGTTPPPDWPHPRQGLPHNGNAGCARGFNASAGGHRGEEADPQCIDPPPPPPPPSRLAASPPPAGRHRRSIDHARAESSPPLPTHPLPAATCPIGARPHIRRRWSARPCSRPPRHHSPPATAITTTAFTKITTTTTTATTTNAAAAADVVWSPPQAVRYSDSGVLTTTTAAYALSSVGREVYMASTRGDRST